MEESKKIPVPAPKDFDAREYQTLAMRTECDQTRSLGRIAVVPMGDTRYATEGRLLATRLLHAAIGLSNESGEVCSAIEKWLYYGRALDSTNLFEEVGDVLWRIAQIAEAVGFNLVDAMEANIAKLRARYPDRYTDEACAVRDREREQAAMLERFRLAVEGGQSVLPSRPEPRKTVWSKETHPSHTWSENGEGGRCTRCGAYRNLGSGFVECPVARRAEESVTLTSVKPNQPPMSSAGHPSEGIEPLYSEKYQRKVEQGGYGYGHVVSEDDGAPE